MRVCESVYERVREGRIGMRKTELAGDGGGSVGSIRYKKVEIFEEFKSKPDIWN